MRPPAEKFVQIVPESYLKNLTNLFTPDAEIIASYKANESSKMELTDENVLSLISRHPATVEQIAEMTGNDAESVTKLYAHFEASNYTEQGQTVRFITLKIPNKIIDKKERE